MATAAYYEWVRLGKPLEPCTPVREVVGQLRAAFPRAAEAKLFSWYADDAHYQADEPKDHTPFSVTGQPLPSPRWVVFATDVMHRPDLGVDCHILFPYWLAEARAGRYPSLKYIIWQAKLYHYRDGFLVAQANSGHFDHVHKSFRTDRRTTSLGSWSLVPTSKGKPMLYQVKGNAKIFTPRGDGYVHMTSPGVLKALEAAGYRIVTVDTLADLEALLGKPYVASKPVTLTGDDRAAIVADLKAGLLPGLVAGVSSKQAAADRAGAAVLDGPPIG